MWALKFSICVLFFASLSNGCHHGKEQFPPDDFPPNNGNNDRRRRSVSTETGATQDADKELVKFFAKCMFEKTGKVFESWTSVIGFILRDTRWYSATDEQYCMENQNKDPNSVSCWKGRLKTLVKLNSKLLPKGEECVEEFDFTYGFDSYLKRKKRDLEYPSYVTTPSPTPYTIYTFPPMTLPTTAPPQLERCPVVSNEVYNRCVMDDLTTASNLAKYPSLKDYDAGSVQKFVNEHYSDCRISSTYIRGRNTYSERCSTPTLTCYPVVLNQIVRTPSPLFGASTTCSLKYSAPPDPCDSIQCPPNESCEDGFCVCDAGYRRNIIGICRPIDPCAEVTCTAPNTYCVGGSCVCRPGYEINDMFQCVFPDPCAGKVCGPYSTCNPLTGKCECHSGYKENLELGWCVELCYNVQCRGNRHCVLGTCVCKPGYAPGPFGTCDPVNPCQNVRCGSHSTCNSETGECECDPGYKENEYGSCVGLCHGVRCRRNEHCILGNCVCKPGYVPSLLGGCYQCKSPKVFENCASACPKTCDNFDKPPEPCIEICVKKCVCPDGMVQKSAKDETCVYTYKCRDKCYNKRCLPNSHCRDGKCICNKGYEDAGYGRCKKINPCKNVKCTRYSHCKDGECVCNTGYYKDHDNNCQRCENPKTFNPCASACPKTCDNLHKPLQPCPAICVRKCECPAGMIERGTNDDTCVYAYQCHDKCYKMRCQPYSTCKDGKCVCNTGYKDNGYGKCVRDKCYGKICSEFGAICVEGQCVCLDGYSQYGNLCYPFQM